MSKKITYQTTIAHLESKVDHLETELAYLNETLIEVGFPRGIETLKETMGEVLLEDALDRQKGV